MKRTNDDEIYEFCVVCPDAQQVYLVGDFNGWSTTATPMALTEEHVWQLSLKIPADDAAAAPARTAGHDARQRSGGERKRFSYFVIDKRWMTGSAAFGNTYLLPGTWASVVRLPANN